MSKLFKVCSLHFAHFTLQHFYEVCHAGAMSSFSSVSILVFSILLPAGRGLVLVIRCLIPDYNPYIQQCRSVVNIEGIFCHFR